MAVSCLPREEDDGGRGELGATAEGRPSPPARPAARSRCRGCRLAGPSRAGGRRWRCRGSGGARRGGPVVTMSPLRPAQQMETNGPLVFGAGRQRAECLLCAAGSGWGDGRLGVAAGTQGLVQPSRGSRAVPGRSPVSLSAVALISFSLFFFFPPPQAGDNRAGTPAMP